MLCKKPREQYKLYKKVELKLLRELEIKNLMGRVHETNIFIEETFKNEYSSHLNTNLERKTVDQIPSDSESSKYLESEKEELPKIESETQLQKEEDSLDQLDLQEQTDDSKEERNELILNHEINDPLENNIGIYR